MTANFSFQVSLQMRFPLAPYDDLVLSLLRSSPVILFSAPIIKTLCSDDSMIKAYLWLLEATRNLDSRFPLL